MFGRQILDWGIPTSPVPLTEYINNPEGLTRKKRYIAEYTDWLGMINRALSYDFKMQHKSYDKVSISNDFKVFEDFYNWVHEEQANPDWRKCQLDKDLLSPPNAKIYSKATCAYVTQSTNGFLISKDAKDIIMKPSKNGIFNIKVSSPFEDKPIPLGKFDSEIEARLAWKSKKHEIACTLAEIERDPRVIKALLERYK